MWFKLLGAAVRKTTVRLMSTSTDSVTKIPRLMMKIGTHNGTFHCDEALACYLLQCLPEYQFADLVRTRDPEELETCDVVVDVGGVYDPEKNRFDHHQRSFTHSMNSLKPEKKWTTKLSSAGLVYFHFGERILSQVLSCKPSDKFTQLIFDKMYENFIEEVDAIDNGVNQTEETPKYTINTNLSSRVSYLNPGWNQTVNDDEMMVRFHKAMELTGSEFLEKVLYYRDVWWPARQLVEEAVEKRFEVDPSGEIIKFAQGGCPWKDHLLTMEEESDIKPSIKFALYPDTNKAWRVQCVPKGRNTFDNRLSLLSEWQGVRDQELSTLSGIADCIFVHASGFIGGNKTYEGALLMAKRTLEGKPMATL